MAAPIRSGKGDVLVGASVGIAMAQQLAMLTADRCDVVQGFLLARPMGADAAAAFLSEENEPAELWSAG